MIPRRPKSCLSRVKRSSDEAETDVKAENLDVLAAADKASNLLVEHCREKVERSDGGDGCTFRHTAYKMSHCHTTDMRNRCGNKASSDLRTRLDFLSHVKDLGLFNFVPANPNSAGSI